MDALEDVPVTSLIGIDDGLPPKTIQRMIVDHAGGLHMCIANRGTYEFKPSLTQILAQRVRFRAGRRIIFQPPDRIDNRLAAHKFPNVGIKAAKGFLNI